MGDPLTRGRPLVVGLTGGIGSGKTLVSDAFARLGAPVIDTDRIARELVEPGQTALGEIAREFGDACLQPDGSLDRAALRRIVFNDPKRRGRLEAILHPRIRRLVKGRVAEVSHPYCIVVVPLLVESGMVDMMDRVLVVDVAPATQIGRVMARDSIPESLAREILKAQADRASRLAAADDVIDNSGEIDAAVRAVQQLDGDYRRLGPVAPR